MFRRVEAELKHALQVLTDIQVALSEACIVTIIDANGRLTYVNDKYCSTTGFCSDDVLGADYNKLFYGEQCEELVQDMKRALTRGRVWRGEVQSYKKDGSPFWVQTTAVPFLDATRRSHQFIAVSTDISDRKIVEEAQREREQQLYTLINAIPDVVLFKDANGRWLETNDTALRLFSIEDDEWYGKTTSDILGTRTVSNSLVREDDSDIWERGTSVREETCFGSRGQPQRIFDTITIPIFRNGKRHRLLVIGRDITERKRREQEVWTMKEEFESIFSYSADAICLFDFGGNLVRTNRACRELYGWREDDFAGRFPPDEESLNELNEWLQTVQETGRQISRETVRKRKDGESIYVSVTLSPIRNAAGQIVAVSTIERDITERVRTTQLLVQSEKLSVAGQLAAGIAHELRNPMTVLRGFTQMIQEHPERTVQYADLMLREFDRVNAIVEELLTLAKPQAVKYEYKDILAILEHVLLLLQTQAAPRNIRLIRRCNVRQLFVSCVENQMKQVFMNVLKNAIEASDDGAEIVIDVQRVGDTVELRFIDHGCGIPEDQLDKIGQPFHTTKPSGTGLGLLVTNRIISDHHGRVEINSRVNVGTEVKIVMPLRSASMPAAQ
ncbi:PAS domain-containing sensor histidine kinase [Alicyclobacillus acidoterrestris]|uniref:histidine kinase n=1 Tax=Alicyclobacillus acidoterrestris (strain ATCC 49025 / DSM 3922 / CIP 106132 / NCIMB 13137 / GD3B) TaxID=1356854 RepID=T0BZR6_ALIAG|nr:PAS domain-containing sensor histidine kinase [Alicyclobacillus acidoterrestris]EPZ46289.1 hypothetical protein N007_07275 [Alicyclobacillus acidoterrestris ATCC 49025]UNO50698.1 PAS domain S-box protein [Alicyclobacillus acidoterrestris]